MGLYSQERAQREMSCSLYGWELSVEMVMGELGAFYRRREDKWYVRFGRWIKERWHDGKFWFYERRF